MNPDSAQPQERHPKLLGAALQGAISELCERRQSMLLATPYLSFESRFLERAGADLRIRATMSRNVVRHALSQQALRLRFPWGLSYYCGLTRILDYEDGDKAKFLRVAMPTLLAPDDLRKTFRIDQVGRSTGALGSQELDLVKISLENISSHGLGVFCIEPLPGNGFQPGRKVEISLSLEHGPHLKAQGRICHSAGQTLGLAFTPELAPEQLEALNHWLEPKLAEAQRRWDDRASLKAQADRATLPRAAPGGVLLVSGDPALHAAMALALDGAQPLRCVPPALAPFKAAMETEPPHLLVISVTGGLEESHRLRTLMDCVHREGPLVVLGTGPNLPQFRALASELKATLFLDRNTLNTPFFRRLVLGLVRKHWNLLEGSGPT